MSPWGWVAVLAVVLVVIAGAGLTLAVGLPRLLGAEPEAFADTVTCEALGLHRGRS